MSSRGFQLKAAKVASNTEAATNCVYVEQKDYEQIFGGSKTDASYLKVPMGLVYVAK